MNYKIRTNPSQIGIQFHYIEGLLSDTYFIDWNSQYLPTTTHGFMLEDFIYETLFQEMVKDKNIPITGYIPIYDDFKDTLSDLILSYNMLIVHDVDWKKDEIGIYPVITLAPIG